jgi:hypothetical protein
VDKTRLSEQRYRLWGHKPVKAAHQRSADKLIFPRPCHSRLLILMAQDARSSTPEDDTEVMHGLVPLVSMRKAQVHLFLPSTNYRPHTIICKSPPRISQKFDKVPTSSPANISLPRKRQSANPVLPLTYGNVKGFCSKCGVEKTQGHDAHYEPPRCAAKY